MISKILLSALISIPNLNVSQVKEYSYTSSNKSFHNEELITNELPSSLTLQEVLPILYQSTVTAIVMVHKEEDFNNKSRYLGTGTHIGNGVILTSSHLFDEDEKYCKVRTFDDKVYKYEIWKKGSVESVAFLKPLEEVTFDNTLGLREEPVLTGESVFTIGHPLGHPYSLFHGIVSFADRVDDRDNQVYVQLDMSAERGLSGSPILDMAGNVVGVLHKGVVTEYGLPGITFSNNMEEILKIRGKEQ